MIIVCLLLHLCSCISHTHPIAAEISFCWLLLTHVFWLLQYDNIDSEHRDIFVCIFNCAKDPSSEGLIKKLYQVTDDHFKDEEVRTDYITLQVVTNVL